MAGGSPLQGKLATKTVSGVLNGKAILATYRLTGRAPSPGEYNISGSAPDSLYGEGIWMRPVRSDHPVERLRVKFDFGRADAVHTGYENWGDLWFFCAKPIPSHNCLVFTRGLSDLVEALGRFADATMTWS